MEEEQSFINENSLLVAISPVTLIFAFVVVIAVAYFCVKAYSNTNDFEKSTKLYLLSSIAVGILFFFLGIPVIMIIGYIIFGFVVSSMISNHFFYKDSE